MSREGSEIMIATYAMHRLWSEWIQETWQRRQGKGCCCDSTLVLSMYWKEHANHHYSRFSAVCSLSSEKAGIRTAAERLPRIQEKMCSKTWVSSTSHNMCPLQKGQADRYFFSYWLQQLRLLYQQHLSGWWEHGDSSTATTVWWGRSEMRAVSDGVGRNMFKSVTQ